MTAKGMLITLEGGEGGGKTTQIQLLQAQFESFGKEVLTLREPGGTVISEQLRNIVLTPENKGVIGETTEVLLFQTARAQIYHELVIPALKDGKIVVMDRSRDSSVVYQGIVRGFGKDLIEQLNDISTQKTTPDLTFLLDLPVEVGMQRKEDFELDRLELEQDNFHQKVRDGYLELAKKNDHKRWHIIDATQPLEKVTENMWQIISDKLT